MIELNINEQGMNAFNFWLFEENGRMWSNEGRGF